MSSEGSAANRGASRGTRNLTHDDLDLYEALNDPAMMEHLGGPVGFEGMAEKLARDAEATDLDRYWVLVIVSEDEPGVAMGTVSIWDHVWNGERINEIGWMVLPPNQGRGVGSASVRETLDKARSTGRWDVLHAFPPVANPRFNAMCRTMGFEMLEETDFEFRGRQLRCNHWRLDLRLLPPAEATDQEAFAIPPVVSPTVSARNRCV